MSMPPPPPPSPGWQPAPPPGAPQYGAPQYGAPQYGAPPYGAPPPGYGYGDQRPVVAYAGFWQRLGGSLLDSLLYGLLMAAFAIPAVVMGVGAFDDCTTFERFDGTTELVCPPGEPDGALLGGAIAIGVVGFVIVAIIYLRALGRTGQTWGRKIVGVKVVRTRTGEAPGFGRALGRTAFANLISGQICYLGYLWMLWDKDKQTWHDKVVDTYVVKA